MNFNKILYLVAVPGYILFCNGNFLKVKIPTKINTNVKSNSEICNKTVKYTIDKVISNDGKEVKITAEMTVDTKAKKITLLTYRNKSKVSFDTEILSFECTLNENMTSGEAVYKGYIVSKEDGNKSNSTIRISSKDGNVIINESDPEKGRQSKYSMIISKWVVLD